jgi:5-dehydro-2-deoxygluconokinase
MSSVPEAFVLGRLYADIYPLQAETALEDVRTFERFVGGFAGNVATGLARLGVRTAVGSGVGDDGHGRFVRKFLEAEGIDAQWIATHPTLRTALAFCELWPPDRFPFLAYRFPTCPDWEITSADLPLDLIRETPLLYVSGTGFAREPSRSATHAALATRVDGPRAVATILDLDWRDGFWERPEEYPAQIRLAAQQADTVLGSDGEFAAAQLTPGGALELGAARVFLKHGALGATLLTRDGSHDVPARNVTVLNGLGAGDAFAAAIGHGMVRRLPLSEVLERANAAGALVATRLGCSAAMPTLSELDDFIGADPDAGER